MTTPCKHAFDDTATVFSGAAQIRTCRKCDRVEVLLVAAGEWMPIDEYVRQRVAHRAAGERG
jgi:hypothetical protein